MAFDKVIDSAKLDADLTTVADAIRERAGTSGKMAFPNGMAEAVKNIPSGGAELPELENPASPEDMVSGKELYDDQGSKISGSVTLINRFLYDKYMATEDGIISSLEADIDEDWLTLKTPPTNNFRYMLEKGAVVEAGVFLSNLGNVQPGDVVAGKTFTSAAGLSIPGKVKEVSTVYTTPHSKATMEWDDDWKASNVLEEDVLLRKGTTVNTWFGQFFFGDAKPEDVRKGKFFTSGYGLNTEGTMEAESGGGLPDGIPYTSGSFTLASTSANVIITHNFNSDKVFVMWAIKDNPAIMQVDRKALMGFLVSTNVYPERTIDISAYNNDGKAPTYEAGRNESWSYNALSIRTSGPGWRESAADSTRRVNYDSNIIELYGTFEKGHVYEWIAVDISSIIPWAEEATE